MNFLPILFNADYAHARRFHLALGVGIAIVPGAASSSFHFDQCFMPGYFDKCSRRTKFQSRRVSIKCAAAELSAASMQRGFFSTER